MLQFESTNFLDDTDESFVSIDLNENEDECEICHQRTEEHILCVLLSDEFVKFEGSFERTGEKLTRAHQVCLDRWSEIIERDLKYNNTKSKQLTTNNENIQSNEDKRGSIIEDRKEKILVAENLDVETKEYENIKDDLRIHPSIHPQKPCIENTIEQGD